MSKVYQCDACEMLTDTPHKIKMKEFYVGVTFDEYGVYPEDSTRKVKIHLCDDCFKGFCCWRNRNSI